MNQPPRASRLRAVLVAAVLAAGLSPAMAAPPPRVAVRCEVLSVGRAGTEALARRELVLEVGMAGELDIRLPVGAGGRPGSTRIQARLVTGPGREGLLSLRVESRVTGDGDGVGESYERQRDLDLRAGSSALMEVAPAAPSGERLALSLSAREAGDAGVSARPRRIDLDLEVAAVDGEKIVVLDRPMLPTLSGHPVSFEVDYPVPSEGGQGFDHVSLQLELTPGYPQEGRLSLSVSLAGGFPGPDGPVISSRDDLRVLAAGETWEMAVRAPAGGDPWLRVRIIPLWRSEPEPSR